MKLDGHLPDDVREARRDELMEVQQAIAFEHAESLIGYELDVLIDESIARDEVSGDADGGDVWAGRCFADAPEIDACVYVEGENLRAGQMVPVEIVRRDDYDLVAVAVDTDAVAS